MSNEKREHCETAVKISDIKLPLNYTEEDILREIRRKLKNAPKDVRYKIIKKSVDARRREYVVYNITVAVYGVKGDKNLPVYEEGLALDEFLLKNGLTGKRGRVVVVGAGPSGLFAALTLAYGGVKVVLIERGSNVDKRTSDVNNFRNTLTGLNTESNIQFGEGGAGTFSDGKLNTGVNSEFIDTALREFHRFGAEEDVLYMQRPHVGTDYLVKIVKNMRRKIVELGGVVLFDTKVSGIVTRNGVIKGVRLANDTVIDADKVIFAIGHSARDTFEMLLSSGVMMTSKAFSIGVRIEHLQKDISFAQYGSAYKKLPPADYRLSCHLDNGRSLYTFCMCPGGEVVPAASEDGGIVTNGMSLHARDGENANSALLVGVDQSDFGETALAGVDFQRKYERLAYNISSSYRAPVMTAGDLLAGKGLHGVGNVRPTYGGFVNADIRECLPNYVVDTIKEGISVFGKKIKGFDSSDAVLTGVETRSSSPVRILRNAKRESNIGGLYPVGEGAGYAGGITSASVDGIKTAIAILETL